MLRAFLTDNDESSPFKEGDLYKSFNLYGYFFEIHYGYYEDCERNNPLVDPMPIYPDFIKTPIFSDDGFPFVTKMQDACQYYSGPIDKERDCGECVFYKHGVDLIGVCACNSNKKEDLKDD